MNNFLISWQIIWPGDLTLFSEVDINFINFFFPFASWFFVKLGACRCGKFSWRLAGILAGVYGKALLDFSSDGELGLHHSLLKPNSLLAETRDQKKR